MNNGTKRNVVIYCDHNGTTSLRHEVKAAIIDGLDVWANPSSNSDQGAFWKIFIDLFFISGRHAKNAIEIARGQLAQAVHLKSTGDPSWEFCVLEIF